MIEEPNEKRIISDPIERTISAYDRLADDYAKTWLNDKVMVPRLESFLNALDEPRCVLDIGCGPGRDVAAMADYGVEAVGIDLARGMISKANQKYPRNIFRQMDQRQLLYPANTFDGIWSCATLHHLPKSTIAEVLSGFARILKPEGVLCAIIKEGEGEYFDEVGRLQSLYSAGEFRTHLNRAGFNIMSEYRSHSDKGTLGKNPKNWLEFRAKKTSGPFFDCEVEDPDCLLCFESRFKLCKTAKLAGASGILWGSDNIYLATDIAPLVEGHLLLTTEPHFVCLGACPASLLPSLSAHKTKVRELFYKAYGRQTIFVEHGPAKPGLAGACINHAHLHCLPTSLPIMEELARLLGPPIKGSVETLQELYSNGQSYLFLEDEGGHGWVFPVSVVPSQYLRRIIATALGMANWNWQQTYYVKETNDVFNRTLKKLLPVADQLNLRSRTIVD